MFIKTTKHIKIVANPQFLASQSSKDDEHYVWAYNINIENLSENDVQLLNRHWVITDRDGQVQEVKGDGVIGKQPIIKPKESFSYTSGTVLNTPSGIMTGSYGMYDVASKELFEVEIPIFSLDSPYQKTRPN